MPTLAELEVWIKGNDSEVKTMLGALDKRLDKFEKDTERKINKAGESFDGFGTKATQAGQALAPLAAVIAATAGYAVKVAAEYQQMGNVFQAVSSASVDEMEKVRQKAVQLGSDLKLPGTSAKDAMGVMVELSKAGLEVAESMDAARGSIMLAAAGQLENARAAEIQANAMNSFNLAGREAGRVADVISEAANASSAGVEDLAQAFAMGSSTAYAAKLTIEEYTASLAAMANAGIKGSDSGTSIKTMLMSLMAPADDARRAMDEINLSFFDGEGAARPFRDVIKDLREGISGLSEAKQADIMKTIFGTDGIRAAQIITRLGDDFDTLIDQMEGAKGSAGKMASAMNGGLKGALDALQSSVETLLLAEGEKGLPALENAVRSLAEGIGKLGDMPDPLKNVVLGTAALVAIGAPALIAIGAMASGVGTLVTAYSTLTAAIGVGGAAAGAGTAVGATAGFVAIISNPVTLAIAAAVLAIGGLTYAYNQVATEGDRYAKQLDEEWKLQAKATEAKLDTLRAVSPLIKEYDALRERTSLTAEESKRMKDILDKIVLQAPELISAYGQSGEAVDIYRDSVKRLGDESDLTKQKLINMATAAYEAQTAGVSALRSSLDMREESARSEVDRLSEQLNGLRKTVQQKGTSNAGVDASMRTTEEQLKSARQSLARILAEQKKLAEQAVAANRAGIEAAKQKLNGEEKKGQNSGGGGGNNKPAGSGAGNGSVARGSAKSPDQIAREISDEYLVALGKAVRSPGPKGDAACAMFASTVLAHYTKGLTDEGEKITWSARGLFDRVIAKGGTEIAREAARAGDLAFRPGSGVSKLHVGLSTGDGRVMDMNGQRNGQRNQMDVGSDKGWRFLRLPDKVIDPKFLVQESEVAGQAMAAAILKPWAAAMTDIHEQVLKARENIRQVGADLEDQISFDKFGKAFADLTSAENRQGVYELAMVMRELEETNQKIAVEAKAETWLKDLAEAAEVAKDPVLQIAKNLGFTLDEWRRLSKGIQDELVGQALLQQMASLGSMTPPDIASPGAETSTGKTGNPFWWAEGALPILRQINETHQEYLAGLAHENAMILANSEAERIRLDLIQQYPSWTSDMVDQAVSSALDVEATRKKADQIQDIIYGLSGWFSESMDELREQGLAAFDDIVFGFTDMVADMAQAWIMSQMQGLFQDLLGGLLSPGGGGSSGKNASGSLPFLKGSRASGGPVDAGFPYLVGERGPEILIPQASGHVYNNSETVSLLKAINSKQSSSLSSKVDGETTVNNVTQPVVVNVTINANDAGSFFGSERQMKQMIAQAVKDGLRR